MRRQNGESSGSACARTRDPSNSAPWAREGRHPGPVFGQGPMCPKSTTSQSPQRVCPWAGLLGDQARQGSARCRANVHRARGRAALGLVSRRQQGLPLPPPAPHPSSPLLLAQEAELSSWERDGSIFGQNE